MDNIVKDSENLTLRAARCTNCVWDVTEGEITISLILLKVQVIGFLTAISNIQPFQVVAELHMLRNSEGARTLLFLKEKNKIKQN